MKKQEALDAAQQVMDELSAEADRAHATQWYKTEQELREQWQGAYKVFKAIREIQSTSKKK